MKTNEIKIFENEEFRELQIAMFEGKEWFPVTQCAKVLGYSNPAKAIRDYCKEKGCTKRSVLTDGGYQEVKFINEGNLYRLIVCSKLPTAEKFESWIFDEVLPTIRKTGKYEISDDTALSQSILAGIQS